jgi:hypothetical protein
MRRAAQPPGRAPARSRTVTPAEAAWIAALPCALLTLAALVVAGPALGRLLLRPGAETFWPELRVDPQPAQHGRWLVGLLGPLLLAASVLWSARPSVRARVRAAPGTIRAAVLAGQAGVLGFVLLCFAAQNNIVFSADFPVWQHTPYFSPWTLLAAAALPVLALALLRGRRIGERLRERASETPALRHACFALAALYVAVWLLTAIVLDSSVGNTTEAVTEHILWTMAEPFAVLNGRTPLVDFHAQYGQLWAYAAAAPMALLGPSIGSYTLAMATGSGLAMLAVYATFRRLVRSSLLALALFAPFLATAFFTILGPPGDRYAPQNLFIQWPLRQAGPFVLAWLTVRHADRAAPRRAWVLFAAAGLIAINNTDYGLAAAAGTLAALAATDPPRSWRAAGRLAAHAAAGFATALATFSLLTLARSGSLPHFGLLSEFPRLYGLDGWEQLPMPELGLHLAVFLTFAAALVLAAVRIASRDGDRPLTAMLAWIGVFGLMMSLYYAGRAHPLALYDFFAPWAFALVLLLLVAVRQLDARAWRRPGPAELAVLFGFGLLLCSLPQTPDPRSQIARITDRQPVSTFRQDFPEGRDLPIFVQRDADRFVAATARPSEPVAILTPLGHRVAYDTGVTNVSPYASMDSIATSGQLQRTIDTLRRAGGRKLYVAVLFSKPEQTAMLERAGFVALRQDRTKQFIEMVDRSAAARS